MHSITPSEQLALTLLFSHELVIGGVPVHHLKGRKIPFWVKYEIDGMMKHRKFASILSWRATLLFAFQARQTITMHEMDEEGRLSATFPSQALTILNENAIAGENPVPALKLVDPNGPAKILITRTRLRRHAVDALHNLSDGGPVFQTIWIADLLRLRSKIGLDLIPAPDFLPHLPIGAYLEAAAKTGKFPEEIELSGIDLDGNIPLLPPQIASPLTQKIIDWYGVKKIGIVLKWNFSIFKDA